MAPATRSRQASGVNKKAPAPKRRTRSTKDTQEWGLTTREDDMDDHHGQNGHAERHHYSGNLVVESREQADFDDEVAYANPLREMAERVGKEVESFAIQLDQFLDNLPTRNTFDAVLELVDDFKRIAEDAESALQKSTQRERAQQLRKEWSEQVDSSTQNAPFKPRGSSSLAEKKKDSVAELRQWQQEVDLWELLRIVLECHHNPNEQAVREEKEDKLRGMSAVHRYTSEDAIYERFLVQDDLARWRSSVKTWLEQTVDHQESDIPEIMDELESRAGRGQGLWSSGWMQTREKIKGEKRLRSWPTTPGAPLPHIKRSDNNEQLVTSLDPDAVSRQNRTLEKPDAYFERAMWIACWEMLRRGHSWEEVSKWCRERNESWRAISIGKAMSPGDVVSKSAWRQMCYLASQDSHMSDYEAAVYGIRGGSVNAVQRVTRTMDDMLYAYYNAALIGQFETYLSQNFPERAAKLNRGGALEDALRDPEEQLVDLILRLRQHSATGQEAVKPMKIVQSYLLADDLGSMAHTLGYAIGHVDKARGGTEKMIFRLERDWTSSENLPEQAIALQPQALRIATHIVLLMRVLTNEKLDDHARDAEENVLVAYIQSLRAAGKRDLIPTYAKILSRGRQTITMSCVLEDISSISEQETMLELITKIDMDPLSILNEQLGYVLNNHLAPGLRSPRPLVMLENVDDTRRYPGERIIAGFLPAYVSSEDDTVLRAVQWYSIIDNHFEATFHSFALTVRKCLVAGKLACALSIVHEFPYETLCLQKSYQTIGRSINLMEYEGPAPAGEDANWDVLREKSRSYYDLQLIIHAIEALSEWRETEAEFIRSTADLGLSSSPMDIREIKERVDQAMEPIITGNILQPRPDDPDEAADLRFIRTRYIPELIIAYNTVLHSAGHIISRDNLISSMDLSVAVADEKYHLTQLFVDCGRMRELVTSFAHTSKAMLVLKAAKKYSPGKNREGKDLGIWEPGQVFSESRLVQERNREVLL